jgi:UDP-glucose-4-epimerase GalE
MKTILVTGGAGYVGSHTCKALAKAGYLPVTYDNLSTGHEELVKWGPLVKGDLADKEHLIETIEQYKPIAVFHFAASAIVAESMVKPGIYYRNNVAGTLNILEAMIESNLKHLIFSSTCATYGQAKRSPIDENHSQTPTSPYGRSKWMAEQMMIDFDQAHGLKTIKLRYFNAAGADLEGQSGETHTPETHLIPSVIQTALGQRSQVSVYGMEFETPDGTAIRDYIHVDDLADAHILALNYLLKTNESHVFNLGSGSGYSVLDIVKAVESFSGQKITLHKEKARFGEPAKLLADSKRAQEILGWHPKRDLKTMIESAYNWQNR